MEKLISTRVRWIRGIAFALLVLASVLPYLNFAFSLIDSEYYSTYATIRSIGTMLCFMIAFGLLLCISSTKTVKIACAGIIVSYLLSYGGYLFPTLLRAALNLIPMYCLSLIIVNNPSELKVRKWGIILILMWAMTAINTVNIYFLIPAFGLKDEISHMSEFYISLMTASEFWGYIWNILKLTALYILIYSPIFNGHYDSSLKGDFNPANRYCIGGFVAVLVGVAGLAILYCLYK